MSFEFSNDIKDGCHLSITAQFMWETAGIKHNICSLTGSGEIRLTIQRQGEALLLLLKTFGLSSIITCASTVIDVSEYMLLVSQISKGLLC